MSDSEITTAPPAPEDMETQPQQEHHQEPNKKPNNSNLTFNIWPPTQRTREAVVTRLIETLSTPSLLSKRYGTLPNDEASAAARLIEEEAFAAAGASASSEDDGIEILQVYSREISRRMLETVKTRAASAASTGDATAPQSPSPLVEPTATASEDISSVQTES